MSKHVLMMSIIMLGLVVQSPAMARLYKCVNDQGKVNYSDKPCPKAERQPIDIVDSGATSGGTQSSPGASRPGPGAPGGRASAINDAYKNIGSNIDNSAGQKYQQNIQQQSDRAKTLSKSNNSMQEKSFKHDTDRLKLSLEKKKRMDDTLSYCQKNPTAYKCRQKHPQGLPLSEAQREDQDKVEQWHKEETKKSDKEYIESVKKDIN